VRGQKTLGEIIQESVHSIRTHNTQKRQLTTQNTIDVKIKCAFQRNLAIDLTRRKPDIMTSEPESMNTSKKARNLEIRHEEIPSKARSEPQETSRNSIKGKIRTSRNIKKFHQGQDQLCFSAHRAPDYTIKNQRNIKKKCNCTIN
jgi:hypothetical protein